MKKMSAGTLIVTAALNCLLAGCGVSSAGKDAADGGSAQLTAAAPEQGATSEANRERVGVFDRTKVLIAYYRSAEHAAALDAMQRERDEARHDGDAFWAAEIERRGGVMQERAHRQLAGRAPLTNIRLAIGDRLPALAKELGVPDIVERDKAMPGVTTVDVTDRIVAMFPPEHAKREKPQPEASR